MYIIIGKGLINAIGKALFDHSAFLIVFVFQITVSVLVSNCRDITFFIIFIVRNAFVCMYDINQIVPLIAVLSAASNLVCDLHNASVLAFNIQHIPYQCFYLIQSIFIVRELDALSIGIFYKAQCALFVVAASSMVYNIRQ